MVAPRPVEEDDLHAYVDGRLDAERREAVERHLAANPALGHRVEDWRAQSEELRRVMRAEDARERDAILARLSQRQPRLPRTVLGRGPWSVAASLVIALWIGGVAGWFARGDQRPSEIARLSVEAASAYRTFANDPARAVEVSSQDPVQLTAWITQKLGRRVALPDLAPSGYRLMGGRVLSAMYGPAAMLIYRDAADNRVTVYVQPMRVGAPAPMQPMRADALDGFAWIARKVGYSVMSDGDRDRLQSVADQVRAEMAS